MAQQTQFTVRFSEEQLERIDRLAVALSKFNGTKASRADSVRFIVGKGFDQAETDLGIAPTPKPKAKK